MQLIDGPPHKRTKILKLLEAIFFEYSSEGIIQVNEHGDVIASNKAAIKILEIKQLNNKNILDRLFPDLEFINKNKNLNESPVEIKYNNKTLEIKIIKNQIGYVMILNNITLMQKYIEELQATRQLNRELQAVYEHFYDTIYITDGKGNTIQASAEVSNNCGLPPEYFVGKNVADLEKEGVFTPSVTIKVLKSKKREIAIQTTRLGKTMVTVGIPVFDDNNSISKVVSITKDISGQINIGSSLTQFYDANNLNAVNTINSYPKIIYSSQVMQNIIDMSKFVAKADTTILIYGESGTGKDLLAKNIHSLSHFHKGPFIKINCGSIPENLIESELYGYEPGTFTGAKKDGKIGYFEAAQNGTLFLDEISEMPLNQQVKLLEVLQEKIFSRLGSTKNLNLNVRFIAATNRNLEEMVNNGLFRKDLFYRLNVVPIYLPPLRNCQEEIPLLTQFILKNLNETHKSNKQFTREAIQAMINYYWPGNIRELENIIERLVLTNQHPFIEADVVNSILNTNFGDTEQNIYINSIIPLSEAKSITEKIIITLALNRYGSANSAAKVLGVDQSTLSRKISKYGITM